MGSKKLGMWLFIVSDSLTFSVLLFTYSYLRLANRDWPRPFPFSPSIIFSTIMTVVLLASSLTMVFGVAAAARGNRPATVKWILATMAGGATFIGLHLTEWFHLIGEGRRPLPGHDFFRLRPRQVVCRRRRGQRPLLALRGFGLDVRLPAGVFDVGEVLIRSDEERERSMSTATQGAKMAAPPKRWMIWTGRVLSAIPVLLLAMSAGFAFARPPQVIEGMNKFGYPESKLLLIAVLEIGSALIYAIPRTAVLGAILMTAYLGGAVATHVRIGDPGYPTAIIAGIFVWAGLYLRDERLRALLPLRRAQ